jgi:predicted ATPase/class 3 adenylate cyclase
VTFLFTDVEGSTMVLERAGSVYAEVLQRHNEILSRAIGEHGGVIVDTAGDSFFGAFPTAPAAASAAIASQLRLAEPGWPGGFELRVRVGLHAGVAQVFGDGYVGLDVHRAARLMAAAHGGQVLASQSTVELLGGQFDLVDLGEHRLKDLSLPQRIYQVNVPGLRIEFPPIRTLENKPTNLPVQRTTFVGREREVVEVTRLLRRPDVPLITIAGAGGVGKTRLALQAAAEVIDEFANGVFFVSLAPLRDPDLVLPTVAQVLGLGDPGRDPADALRVYLREKELLLVVDNFEHVDGAAPVLGEVCTGAPNVKLLTTSRGALALYGEHVFPLEPLDVPDTTSLTAVAGTHSVALFVDRARAARSSFELTNENAAAVADVCRRLDGLPLAIELAAARVRVLPPQTIRDRLNQRFQLLTGGSRDVDARQQTLQATIDWSYQLLAPEEQTLFRRLSVFAGGCRIEAAERVCDADADLDLPVLDGLIALSEKSLLRQRDDFDGEPRFWMLETVRAYAAERLGESGEGDRVADAQLDYLAAFALEAKPHWRDPDAGTWQKTFRAELDNVRNAIASARARGESARAVEVAANIGWLWGDGFAREGESVLAALLDEAPDAAMATRAWARAIVAIFAAQRGTATAEQLALVLGECEASGLRDAAELVRISLAQRRLFEGRVDEAAQLIAKAVAASDELGDEGVRAWTISTRAVILGETDRLAEARQLLREEATRPYYRSNTNHLIALLGTLCELELGADNAHAALPIAERALALALKTEDVFQLPFTHASVAHAAVLGGEHQTAEEHLDAAEAIERSTRTTAGGTMLLAELNILRAATAAARGDHERARALHDEGTRFFDDNGYPISASLQLVIDRYLADARAPT